LTKKNSNILFCALGIYARVGGMERFNRRVVDTVVERALRDNEDRAVVHILHDQPEQIPATDGSTILKGFKGRRAAFMRESLAVAIRKSDVLILGHINLLPIAFFAKILKPSLKTLLFAHGVEVWDLREFRRKRFYEPWMLHNSTDRVAAVSRYTANVMVNRFGFPEHRISILPNAVDPVTTGTIIDRPGAPILLAVTRLWAGESQKNVDKIIYAMAALKTRFPALALEIVGDGDLRGELEALAAKLELKERVRFLGKVSNADLQAAYKRASIFVLPSAKEGFGIVYLEAWQHGLAVIGARAGATPELVEDGVDGLLVDLNDPTALVDAIARLAQDSFLMCQLALAGKRKVEERYLHEHFAANFNGIVSGPISKAPTSG
jgi:glycosyltransferase involved in cell wall biosynthesis